VKNYIYGAGHYSRIIVKELLKQGFKFEAIIDKYTKNTELYGIPIIDSARGLDVSSKMYAKDIGSVVLFEPGGSNRTQLIKLASQHQEIEYYIYPCGVWSENTFLRFSANSINSMSHVISGQNSQQEGVDQVMYVDLDSTVMGARPNFIKMDIEGLEIPAIMGA